MAGVLIDNSQKARNLNPNQQNEQHGNLTLVSGNVIPKTVFDYGGETGGDGQTTYSSTNNGSSNAGSNSSNSGENNSQNSSGNGSSSSISNSGGGASSSSSVYARPNLSNVIKVIELRFNPHGEDRVTYNPNYLSQELKRMIQTGSQYKGRTGVVVQTVEVIDVNDKFPNPGTDWETNYNLILSQYGLCSKIKQNKIDQIWMWVDPLEPNQGGGIEYSISSPYFRNTQYADGVPSIPYCNGESSFVMFGFDTTRTPDLAFHSFGHMMEAYLGNIEGVDLFWGRFVGGYENPNLNIVNRCGNVHFPPTVNANEA
jgi:hypothetical protein